MVWITGILIAICGFFATRAVAEGDKSRVVAYQAKNMAEDALGLANDLKVQIADVRVAQETFRKEYRQDQKDLDQKLIELLKAVNA